ncbi:serine/threonine protein phosphatase [Paenibacillus faecis]|uniref:metallophosphoesterase n=1 Tax=Paenibacillus faecis TaxID=862114 RepID=UPI001B0D6973|nr:metallophosphoesterase [Paenibacillus faecis]GIO87997.1 serine/threonine protein phosphatase [Paenibacillus faecis]
MQENGIKGESRLLVISDIHGHTEGLKLLLQKAGYRPGLDRLLLLGDYIDTDPHTLGTLLYVKRLVQEGAKALPGNQEMALLTALPQAVDADPSKSSQQVKPKIRDAADWLNRMTLANEVAAWLRGLPLYLEEDGYLFVHAGIRPGKPLSEQTAADLTEIREEFWMAEGDGEPETYRAVFFGHTPTFKLGGERGRLWCGRGKVGLDTGAKHGCRLTLLDVHQGIVYSCSTDPCRLYRDYSMEWLSKSYWL